jgi:uncharacterized membrane protein YadS
MAFGARKRKVTESALTSGETKRGGPNWAKIAVLAKIVRIRKISFFILSGLIKDKRQKNKDKRFYHGEHGET